LLDGLRVVSLDLRGHGLSEHRPTYRYDDYVDDLVGLLDELGLERAPIAGHSLGGYVALLAASRSDRIGPVLAIDVKSDWTEADAAFVGRARDATQRVEPEREALVARLAAGLAHVTLQPDELELLSGRAIEEVDGGWRYRWDRRVLAPEPVGPFAFLPRVRCPVHVQAGSESDVMPPESARRFAEAIPGATVEILEGVGHHPELEAPERVATALRGLVTNAASAT